MCCQLAQNVEYHCGYILAPQTIIRNSQVVQSDSRLITVASSQSMMWFSVLTWSVIAGLFCFDCDWLENTVDQGGCQNPTGRASHHKQRRGGLPAVPRLHDDLLLSAATTVATNSREFSVWKKATIVAKTSLILGKYFGCFSTNR